MYPREVCQIPLAALVLFSGSREAGPLPQKRAHPGSNSTQTCTSTSKACNENRSSRVEQQHSKPHTSNTVSYRLNKLLKGRYLGNSIMDYCRGVWTYSSVMMMVRASSFYGLGDCLLGGEGLGLKGVRV